MQTWKWLTQPAKPYTWGFMARVVVKAAVLFALLNVIFALVNPLPTLGHISAYNTLLTGRERLPYGENPPASYNLSLYNLPAMVESLTVDTAPADDEFRVLLLGDSSVWGILLEPQDTLAGQINRLDLRTADGRRVRAYNLGYPTMSLTKDLMLLDYALEQAHPDLIVWLFTLESFAPDAQLEPSFVQNNAERVQALIRRYDLSSDPGDPRFVEPDFWQSTIVGQRRALADLLRLQLYGVMWSLTGIDQEYPDDYTRRSVDLDADESWHTFETPQTFTADDLAFDALAAGAQRAGSIPVLFVNEPIFISQGENSDVRYNAFYPRWAYDSYRDVLAAQTDSAAWPPTLDLWDLLPDVECYTDSPVHLTLTCESQLATRVGEAILDLSASAS
ncbi:MAG TPA: hypothetical protein PKD09_12250 [Aggregatilinea sp.]|uniref:hypothetical protein n=1 Tax=Aggregatilinea sp. TaxID=2806333 RepID=UPI002CD5F30D|nr:hypothetical protein [Aggregatilinea sp.]HML22415.1 hypothetical protein [Aggregatilinea sp.]